MYDDDDDLGMYIMEGVFKIIFHSKKTMAISLCLLVGGVTYFVGNDDFYDVKYRGEVVSKDKIYKKNFSTYTNEPQIDGFFSSSKSEKNLFCIRIKDIEYKSTNWFKTNSYNENLVNDGDNLSLNYENIESLLNKGDLMCIESEFNLGDVGDSVYGLEKDFGEYYDSLNFDFHLNSISGGKKVYSLQNILKNSTTKLKFF